MGRVRRRAEQELVGEREGERKVRAAISLPPTINTQTIDFHRPLAPATSLPARRALPRIPEEEEKSCLGSTTGSIGSSLSLKLREERCRRPTTEENPREAKESLKRATTHGDWENPYWGSNSLLSMYNNENSRSFERHKLHSAATSSDAEHIYEEIDWPSDAIEKKREELSDLDDEDEEEISFLDLISHERRNHLRYYGCTGWDRVHFLKPNF